MRVIGKFSVSGLRQSILGANRAPRRAPLRTGRAAGTDAVQGHRHGRGFPRGRSRYLAGAALTEEMQEPEAQIRTGGPSGMEQGRSPTSQVPPNVSSFPNPEGPVRAGMVLGRSLAIRMHVAQELFGLWGPPPPPCKVLPGNADTEAVGCACRGCGARTSGCGFASGRFTESRPRPEAPHFCECAG